MRLMSSWNRGTLRTLSQLHRYDQMQYHNGNLLSFQQRSHQRYADLTEGLMPRRPLRSDQERFFLLTSPFIEPGPKPGRLDLPNGLIAEICQAPLQARRERFVCVESQPGIANLFETGFQLQIRIIVAIPGGMRDSEPLPGVIIGTRCMNDSCRTLQVRCPLHGEINLVLKRERTAVNE